jgi:hypothetical protein
MMISIGFSFDSSRIEPTPAEPASAATFEVRRPWLRRHC